MGITKEEIYDIDKRQLHPLKFDAYGLLVGHTWAEVGVLLDLINRYHVTRFVEIGVHVGGLTAIMSPLVKHKPGFAYMAIEINPSIPVQTVKELPVEFVWGDCFDPAIIEQVKAFIWRSPSLTFVYCDNGVKAREFPVYAPLLRSGDLIAAHDYGTEIMPADVLPVAGAFNLQPIEIDEPTRITAWRKA